MESTFFGLIEGFNKTSIHGQSRIVAIIVTLAQILAYFIVMCARITKDDLTFTKNFHNKIIIQLVTEKTTLTWPLLKERKEFS